MPHGFLNGNNTHITAETMFCCGLHLQACRTVCCLLHAFCTSALIKPYTFRHHQGTHTSGTTLYTPTLLSHAQLWPTCRCPGVHVLDLLPVGLPLRTNSRPVIVGLVVYVYTTIQWRDSGRPHRINRSSSHAGQICFPVGRSGKVQQVGVSAGHQGDPKIEASAGDILVVWPRGDGGERLLWLLLHGSFSKQLDTILYQPCRSHACGMCADPSRITGHALGSCGACPLTMVASPLSMMTCEAGGRRSPCQCLFRAFPYRASSRPRWRRPLPAIPGPYVGSYTP